MQIYSFNIAIDKINGGGGEGGVIKAFLGENYILIIPSIKSYFHFLAKSEILLKSLFNIAAVSAGSVPVANREVSSAKIKMSLSMSSTISFI
jgi:hypothetical protein